MKIVFFGLGSIGKKHAIILLNNYDFKLYAFRSKINKDKNTLGIEELNSWEDLKNLNPDVAFITNPTFLHIETAIKCAELGCHLFIEKPIDKDDKRLRELVNLVKKNNLTAYIAYPLRFHPVIKRLKKYLGKHRLLHARVVCSSYLPLWRKEQDHLKSYSASLNMGGGVLLDLSHELDYISYLLNGILDIQGNFGKRSDLTLDAEDYADLLINTQNCPVNLHIDFLSQIRQRYLQIDFSKITILADLITAEIKEFQNEELTNQSQLDYQMGQEFKEQIEYFFNNLNNPHLMNNLSEASSLFKKIVEYKTSIYE